MTDHGSPAHRHAALVDSLVRDGEITDPRLLAAFRSTPRHMFIPEKGAHDCNGAEIDASVDREGWLDAVYADAVVVTRLDDEAPASHPGMAATSSSSSPTVMAWMLEAAELRDGHRVLEIGAGTGWNAALLAARLGGGAVTSLDIDPEVAATARDAVARLGRDALVLHGDGEDGHPPGAPYDRVIATCNVARVPAAWLRQTAPGGLVITPWSTVDGFGGALARLTRAADGSASGPLLGRLGFIWLRGQRPPAVRPVDPATEAEQVTRVTSDPMPWLTSWDATFPLSFMVPSWRGGLIRGENGPMAWFAATDGPAWARVRPENGGWTVEQAGPRRLWDEIGAALEVWRGHGGPGRDRYGLSVSADGTHRVWLDTADGPGWTLPR